jgi:hypothetical protein
MMPLTAASHFVWRSDTHRADADLARRMIAFQSGGNAIWDCVKEKNARGDVVRCGNNFVEKLSMDLVPAPNRRGVCRFQAGRFPSDLGSR